MSGDDWKRTESEVDKTFERMGKMMNDINMVEDSELSDEDVNQTTKDKEVQIKEDSETTNLTPNIFFDEEIVENKRPIIDIQKKQILDEIKLILKEENFYTHLKCGNHIKEKITDATLKLFFDEYIFYGTSTSNDAKLISLLKLYFTTNY